MNLRRQAVFLGGIALFASHGVASEYVEIPSVLIRWTEQVDVPAREAGVLDDLLLREGEVVSRGTLLGKVESEEAELLCKRAQMELEMARVKAENNVRVRFSRKSFEVAQAELERATRSEEKYHKSVSQTELDRLQLTAERAELEIEQAEHELVVSRTNLHLKKNALEFAQWSLDRRKIIAPLSGVVAQIHRRRGEWVEPGEKVLRILRLDRLRAEGFLDIQKTNIDLMNRQVTVTVDVPDGTTREFMGKIVFVSPEIDPINGQIRIWGEVDNQDLVLRPGLRGVMQIGVSAKQSVKPEVSWVSPDRNHRQDEIQH